MPLREEALVQFLEGRSSSNSFFLLYPIFLSLINLAEKFGGFEIKEKSLWQGFERAHVVR